LRRVIRIRMKRIVYLENEEEEELGRR